MYRCLYGPVLSRRLGLSLGVDLVPLKTCTFDCVFCQLGSTGECSLERGEHVPVDDVLGELDSWLRRDGEADYVTLCGSGEPTLHSRFGGVIDAVHGRSSLNVALMTNGSLLYLPGVRADAARADLVKVSLSAWDPVSFRTINRPHGDLRFKDVVEGLRLFRRVFKGVLWMEVFVLAGINDSPEAIRKIAKLAESVGPDRVHLNTAVRPPAEETAVRVDSGTLERLALFFDPPAELAVESEQVKTSAPAAVGDRILAALLRRPSTSSDLASAFGIDPAEVSGILEELCRAGLVRKEAHGDEMYYRGK